MDFDEFLEVFNATGCEGWRIFLVAAMHMYEAVFGFHFETDFINPVRVLAQELGDIGKCKHR
jgi:hypothetical protein